MNKVLAIDTRFRVSMIVTNDAGEDTKHYVGWARTDKSVKLGKDVKCITASQSDQVANLLAGDIEEIDPDAKTNTLFLATGKPGEDTTQFLGYFNPSAPAKAEAVTKIWPKLVFELAENA